MLADLIKVQKRIFEALDKGGHATEGGSLQLLALEKRLTVFEQTDVVSGNGLNQVLGGGKLTESDAEMVGIVEGVEKILVERVDVLEPGKALEDGAELLGESFLTELDLSGVES